MYISFSGIRSIWQWVSTSASAFYNCSFHPLLIWITSSLALFKSYFSKKDGSYYPWILSHLRISVSCLHSWMRRKLCVLFLGNTSLGTLWPCFTAYVVLCIAIASKRLTWFSVLKTEFYEDTWIILLVLSQ